jgi:hypothetical protein
VFFALALLAFGPLFGALDGITVTSLLGACAAVFTLALAHAALAFTLGAATGRRGPAVAISAAVAVTGYLIQNLLATSSTAQPLRNLSPWHWYLQNNMLTDGPNPTALWLPLLLTAFLFTIGWAPSADATCAEGPIRMAASRETQGDRTTRAIELSAGPVEHRLIGASSRSAIRIG